MISEEEIIEGITNIIYTCNDVLEDKEWYNQEEIESAKEQLKFTKGLLDLYNKTKNQLEEKTYLYNKLDTESKHLIEKQQKEIEDLEIKTKVVTAYHCDDLPKDVKMIILSKNDFERNISNDYISKDKIREVIKKYYDDYEMQKEYRYTLDVEDEQNVLKDIAKELLEE